MLLDGGRGAKNLAGLFGDFLRNTLALRPPDSLPAL